MLRIVSILTIWAMGLGAFWALPQGAMAGDERRITVTGHGQIAARPDMATLTLGVTATDEEARVAMQEVSDRVGRILTLLQDQGLEVRDVQTRRLTLNPLWSNRSSVSKSEPDITGFSASNMVMVRVRDLDRLGLILDAVLGEGANEFHGLSFGLQDPDPLASEARQAAVRDAMARAGVLADTAGVALGDVMSISEEGGMAQPQMMEMAASRGGAVPVAEGEVTVQASVTMVFAIGE